MSSYEIGFTEIKKLSKFYTENKDNRNEAETRLKLINELFYTYFSKVKIFSRR